MGRLIDRWVGVYKDDGWMSFHRKGKYRNRVAVI